LSGLSLAAIVYEFIACWLINHALSAAFALTSYVVPRGTEDRSGEREKRGNRGQRIKAGRISFSLRKKGVTIPTTDLIIASLAIENHCSVMTLDSHFNKIPDLMFYR